MDLKGHWRDLLTEGNAPEGTWEGLTHGGT